MNIKTRGFWNLVRAVPPNAVFVATHSPGFSTNLSKWRLIIDEEGNVYQDTDVWEWTAEKGILKERREEQTQIGTNEVAKLLRMAQEVMNQPLPEPSDWIIEDAATQTLMVRVAEHLQKVPENADGFLELWREVHRHAPYSPKW